MLPPDNFQEDPTPVVAHRTSPTNLGLYLLSVVSARDSGGSGPVEAVERLEATLATMHSLERFRGHFYNWYDTRDLRPLDPRYVSSVDSGNLAGHLIALANAAGEWSSVAPGHRRLRWRAGDASSCTREARPACSMTPHPDGHVAAAEEALVRLSADAARHPLSDELTAAQTLCNAAQHAETMVDIARALATDAATPPVRNCCIWAEASPAPSRPSPRPRRDRRMQPT